MRENKQCFLLSFSLGEEAHVSIDLRQDTIEAIPYPGQAIGMKETFLYGRGVIESILEGKVMVEVKQP